MGGVAIDAGWPQTCQSVQGWLKVGSPSGARARAPLGRAPCHHLPLRLHRCHLRAGQTLLQTIKVRGPALLHARAFQ